MLRTVLSKMTFSGTIFFLLSVFICVSLCQVSLVTIKTYFPALNEGLANFVGAHIERITITYEKSGILYNIFLQPAPALVIIYQKCNNIAVTPHSGRLIICY